ncbi:hypothetical protein D3OALGA1CA_737 [Olavius algarvensis associated proteobacterium Delta 3]|nr:hypothetical protein D3OALGB2SA_60 [Olavius algarvensis associated proteobacterium Delta 3]CAB5088408.1 hypothetical protein D3OALGA1CA_737 [Olavius algarvensis associated proteobacterium Delta 3]
METLTAESQRAQRNCLFPRIPERGILGKDLISRLKLYTFCQTIFLHFALYVLPARLSCMSSFYFITDLQTKL